MNWIRISMTLTILVLVSVIALGQPAPAKDTPAADPAKSTEKKPAKDKANGDQPSAEEVMGDLLNRRDDNPLIEPARPIADPKAKPSPLTTRPKTQKATPDGSAPNPAADKLKREGSFVILRRGRLVRATRGASPWMFVFDADKDTLQDPPMYIMPCQMLEDMEQIVDKQNESAVFIVSGQIFVYHKANYLLPTLMKLAPRRGNLQR